MGFTEMMGGMQSKDLICCKHFLVMVLSICYRWDIWMCLWGSLFYIYFVSIAVIVFSCFCSVVSYSYLLLFQLHFFQEKVFEQIFLITRSVECFTINVTLILWEPICTLRACHSLLDSLHKFSIKSFFSNCEQKPCFLNWKLHFLSSDLHSVKSVHIWSFSGLYFPAFGLNMERYFVSLRIQSKCGKIRARKNSEYGQFSRSDLNCSYKRRQKRI